MIWTGITTSSRRAARKTWAAIQRRRAGSIWKLIGVCNRSIVMCIFWYLKLTVRTVGPIEVASRAKLRLLVL